MNKAFGFTNEGIQIKKGYSQTAFVRRKRNLYVF